MSATVRSESFHAVGEQVSATLQEAHVALESFAEGDAGTAELEQTAGLLHAARGALQIAEVYGASLLAEEMEATCRWLAEGERPERAQVEGVEALSRAMVQLPAYIERVMGGGRDIPLVLLPLLNDLRAARGNPLMSESTLLLLNVEAPVRTGESSPREPSGEDIRELVRKLRPQFQLGLLGWIKGGDTGDDLQRMTAVAARLESAASTNEVHQLWWVVGGVLEALAADGLEASVALKRLVGQADREIKRLLEHGEDVFAAEPPTDLVNNLLYYVARAKAGGPRVDAIRRAFNLAGFGPGDEQVDELRAALSAPSARLMKTVADAIREDLGRAKDVLDIYVRTGMEDTSELAEQVELLRKISDTLGVLGLGALREIVVARASDLEKIVASSPEGLQEADLVALAASLLEVETRLDSELVDQVRDVETADEDPELSDAEFHQVAGAVLRECIVNLGHIKEGISSVLAQSGDSAAVDGLDDQLRGISAGLMMLGKSRAVDILNRVGQAIRDAVSAGLAASDAESLNRLADSIVSLEYYMETMKAGRREPVYMLDNAERSLEAIEKPAVLPGAAAPAEAQHTRTLKIDTEQLAALPGEPQDDAVDDNEVTLALDAVEEPDSAPESEQSAAPADPTATAVDLARTAIIEAPVLDTDAGQPDPELLECFIEEAREEIEVINRHFPVWRDNQDDEEALITIRRSFHTLKGSGRMVGAALIGEFSWNIENLLNKVIGKSVEVTAPLLTFIGEAVAALPQLLEQLEAGTEPEVNLAAIAADATSFAEGELPLSYTHVSPEPADEEQEEPDEGVLLEPEALQTGDTESAPELEPEPEGIDPVLLEILGRETAGHIGNIRAFLDGCEPGAAPFIVTEAMHHACHTLHGSITMANASAAAVVTEPLYAIVEHLYRRGQGLDPDDVGLCREAVDEVENVIAWLTSGEGEAPDTIAIETKLQAVAQTIAEASDVIAESDATAELPAPDLSLGDSESDSGLDIDLSEAAEPATPPPEFDPEIAGIFVEEAAEILEAADSAIALLAQNKTNIAPLQELQRHLHTLKGGARMAGVVTMGDFSHELESLLIRVIQGGAGLDDDAFRLLQSSIDELHRMGEEVVTGSVAAPDANLMARLTGVVEATMVTPAIREDDVPAPAPEPPAEEPAPAVPELGTEEGLQDIEVDDDEDDDEEAGDETLSVPSLDTEPTDEALAVDEEPALPRVPEPANLGELARELTSDAPPPQSDESLAETDDLDTTQHAPAPDVAPRREMARVDSAMLEELLNNAGEISISHSRLTQQVTSLHFNLDELAGTVQRLQRQLRKLEMETEAQILFRHQTDAKSDEEFDPLELDRYSTIQQLSRGLAETASDVNSIKDLLQNITSDTETILSQQARTTSELQDTLMRTRMVPFDQHVPRLSRLVRQQAAESGKQVELVVEGSSGELDRQVMEKMLPPFEHMLRNAIIHGIESPEDRAAAGKPEEARISIRFLREGSQVLIEVADDGAGVNLDAVREKAVKQGLIKSGQQLSDDEAAQLILRSGLSTADKLTQSAGRGIGMDVVVSEIAKLGGTLAIDTMPGKGCVFTVRLPYTLAITQAFIVQAGAETFALPLPSVEGVVRIARDEFIKLMAQENPSIDYGGRDYRLRHLGLYVGLGVTPLPEDADFVSIILVEAGKNSTALITDETADNREIVVKPVGPMLAQIRGIAGATILPDGRIVVILDAPALVRSSLADLPADDDVPQVVTDDTLPPLALVVDDSITMRRVTQRLLERNGMRVITAKDGVEALEVLQEHRPEIIVLDVEMPRMDGYEFAGHVRNNAETANLPIIMVTSRTGEKHRARAIELGVNDYLGKPYQEAELFEAMRNLLGDDFNKPRSQRRAAKVEH